MKNIVKIFIFMIFILGIVYPLAVYEIGNVFMQKKINGSLVQVEGKIIGSKLIAQEFKSDMYFHPRPSSNNYNPMASGASNFGPISKSLKDQIALGIKNNLSDEMLFNSGSGLDPHIYLTSALKQVDRIAVARNLTIDQKNKLIQLIKDSVVRNNQFLFGRPLINVLELNILINHGL